MAESFGPYRLIRRLAQGGMGEVWLAVLEREGGFQKTVAIKTMLPALAKQAGFAEQFESEATLAAHLNHANIAQVFDHGTVDGRSYITMEFVEGPDLATLLAADEGQPLPVPIATEIALQACRGLAHAHTRRDLHGREVGLIHGDMSPSNVLLSTDGQVKLVDFGLASLRGATETAGVISGKLSYMSPEQARGEILGPASDLFSLGLVLYEMLSALRAYPLADPPAATLAAIRAGTHAPLDTLCPGLPKDLCAVVDRALQTAPGDRFGSAADMGQAIEASGQACGPAQLSRHIAARAADHLATARLPEPTEVASRPISPDAPSGTPPSKARWRLLILAGLSWALGFGWWIFHEPPAPRPDPPALHIPRAPTGLTARPAAGPDGGPGTTPDAGPDAGVKTDPDAAKDPAPRAHPRTGRRKLHPRPVAPVRPAAVDPAPPGPGPSPSPPLATIRLPAGLAAELDHRPVDGGEIRWSDRAAHLIELLPSADGSPQIQIRIGPHRSGPAAWRAAIRAKPWMRIQLDGRELGQTPRSGLRIRAGRRRLVLHRDGAEQVIELHLGDPGGAQP